jgi:hypothetical protein
LLHTGRHSYLYSEAVLKSGMATRQNDLRFYQEAGYRVADVIVDGVSQGAVPAYVFTNIAADHAISAIFTLIQYYDITASAGPNGSISPTGTVSVPEFTNKTYTITPAW